MHFNSRGYFHTKFVRSRISREYIAVVIGIFGLADVASAAGIPNDHANNPAFQVHSAPVCPGPANAGSARCHAWVVTDANGIPRATGLTDKTVGPNAGHGNHGGNGGSNPPPPPSGAYGPVQFQTAYGLLGMLSGGSTVAIVDAYDNPTIEQDLAIYSNAYHLPSCTTANGCFSKVNQTGGTSYPRANSGWALEIALDVQAVHAVCPDCQILLVEARSNSLSNLLIAEDYARNNADVVSNSWGAGEFSSESAYDGYFGGVPTTVSSGDSGYGVEWPAASPKVTAVGGTTLTLNVDDTHKDEKVWKYSGSGCSAYEAQPMWQSDPDLNLSDCNNRIVADVAADADPATGAAVYDSYGYAGQSGWFTVGGTSLSSPIIAAVYALAGNLPGASTVGASTVYFNVTSSGNYPHYDVLYDINQGFNGSCGNYLCNAQSQPGYDGPTGLGTPNGLYAFE
jgi:subtilase family serine protease